MDSPHRAERDTNHRSIGPEEGTGHRKSKTARAAALVKSDYIYRAYLFIVNFVFSCFILFYSVPVLTAVRATHAHTLRGSEFLRARFYYSQSRPGEPPQKRATSAGIPRRIRCSSWLRILLQFPVLNSFKSWLIYPLFTLFPTFSSLKSGASVDDLFLGLCGSFRVGEIVCRQNVRFYIKLVFLT